VVDILLKVVNSNGPPNVPNPSLISANTLLAILEGFKASKLKSFPHNLLMRDVVIQEDRVLKAMGR
jgi:hypothetical protein